MHEDLHQSSGHAIGVHRLAISEAMVSQQYERYPGLAARYGERGRLKCLQDAGYHLDYLAESLTVAQPLLFTDYLAWAKIMLAGRNIPVEDLMVNMDCLSDALRHSLSSAMADVAVEYVTLSMDGLKEAAATIPTFLVEHYPLARLAQEYLEALLAGNRQIASRLVLDAVESGTSIQDIYLQVFQSCQHEIGRLWQMNRISVAQEHYCTAATQLIMSQLYPYLFTGERIGRTLVATCIAGDLHEIGVRMVSDIFELNGWNTFYLGANTPLPGILETVRERRADVLAISATIVPHLRFVGELITQLREAPDCHSVKIIVGGYPFNIVPGIWRQLGAHGYAQDAVTAVDLANRLVSKDGLS